MKVEELYEGLRAMQDSGRLHPTFDDVVTGLESYVRQTHSTDLMWYIESACRRRQAAMWGVVLKSVAEKTRELPLAQNQSP